MVWDDTPLALKTIWILLAVFALLHAVLRYTEQKTNHYIAFTLLAIVRDKVFKSLRRLCPHHLPHMYRNSYRDRNVPFHRQLSPLYGPAGGSAYIVAQPLQQRSCGYLRNAHSASGVHVPPYNGNKALYPQQKNQNNTKRLPCLSHGSRSCLFSRCIIELDGIFVDKCGKNSGYYLGYPECVPYAVRSCQSAEDKRQRQDYHDIPEQ